MKIGIVTQQLNNNYGGVLQNFALQQVLKRLGHEPVTLDFRAKMPWDIWIFSTLQTLLLKMMFRGKGKHFFPLFHAEKRISPLMPFVEKHIHRTREINNYSSKLIEEYQLDAVITGSDQVWRPLCNQFSNKYFSHGYIEDMFLPFVKKAGVRKFAYAASFGVDVWEYSPRQTRTCTRLAKRLDAVSVREQSGIALCRDHLGVEALEVLDPTLLLSAEDYGALCTSVPRKESNLLVAYVLDMNEEKRHFIRNIADQNGLEAVTFSADKQAQLSVEEWLSTYRDAAFVITDSFHGTVFSILNHKPFLSLVNVFRGGDRFNSLLQKVGLSHRMVSNFNVVPALDAIDWESVDTCLEKWRTTSLNYLRKNLN